MQPLADFSYSDRTRLTVTGNVTSFRDLRQQRSEHRLAAVALTIAEDAGESCIIVTRRSPRLSEHSGQ